MTLYNGCKDIFHLYGLSRGTGERYTMYIYMYTQVVWIFFICKDFPGGHGERHTHGDVAI